MDSDRITISKQRLFFWSVIIAILNPMFSGLIIGLLMLSEPGLRKEGRIVTLFAVAWGVIAMLLLTRYRHLLAV